MMKKKPYWEMTTDELAEATREFDDPNYNPPTVKPTKKQRDQLRLWRRKARERSKLVLLLEQKLIEQTDEYAANHGVSFSEVVSNALRQLMRKKSV
jgi:hypothetical protein